MFSFFSFIYLVVVGTKSEEKQNHHPNLGENLKAQETI